MTGLEKIIRWVASTLAGVLVFALFSWGFTEFALTLGIVAAVVVYATIPKIIKDRKLNQGRSKQEQELRFKNNQMTPEERAHFVEKKLKSIEEAYKYGDITLFEYEVLQKKYKGESFYVDSYGLAGTAAASKKHDVERAIEKQKKDAERNLIISATVGEAVGGLSGAIVGAASSIQKSSQEVAALEKKRIEAEEEFKQVAHDHIYGKN